MKKRLLALALSSVLGLSLLAGCGDGGTPSGSPSGSSAPSPSASEPAADPGTIYTMRIGTLTVEAEQNTATALDFAERIEEATNGQVVVQVYPTAQLGTAAQMIEGMQTGTIEGALFPTDYLSSADPSIGFISVPGFAGDDIDSLCAVMNELGGVDIANQSLTQAGLHMIGLLYTDKYTYFLSDRKITSLADCNGMKLWAPPSDYTDAIINGMGATATFFDTSDLAVSIQQKTVNGALASPALYAAQKLYETDKYCMGMVGRCGATAFIMSESFLQSLPEDLRQTVLDVAMTSILEFEYLYAAAAAEANVQVLIDNDCDVYMSTDYPELQAELEGLYEANLELYLSQVSNGQELYDAIHPLLEQYRAG